MEFTKQELDDNFVREVFDTIEALVKLDGTEFVVQYEGFTIVYNLMVMFYAIGGDYELETIGISTSNPDLKYWYKYNEDIFNKMIYDLEEEITEYVSHIQQVNNLTDKLSKYLNGNQYLGKSLEDYFDNGDPVDVEDFIKLWHDYIKDNCKVEKVKTKKEKYCGECGKRLE